MLSYYWKSSVDQDSRPIKPIICLKAYFKILDDEVFLLQEGCFIVRPGRDPNPYSLSVYSGGIVNLVIRQRSDMNYALGTEKVSWKIISNLQYIRCVRRSEWHGPSPRFCAGTTQLESKVSAEPLYFNIVGFNIFNYSNYRPVSENFIDLLLLGK